MRGRRSKSSGDVFIFVYNSSFGFFCFTRYKLLGIVFYYFMFLDINNYLIIHSCDDVEMKREC